jgi:hypothetical protein
MNWTHDQMISVLRTAFADGSLTMSRIDDESGVLVHVPQEMLVNLNASACVIIDHLSTEPSATLGSCADKLVATFDVAREVALHDCEVFLTHMARKLSGESIA